MPLEPGSSQIGHNISELTHHGSRPRSHDQIVAIALANARRHPRADGGQAHIDAALRLTRAIGGAAPDVPYFERQENREIQQQPYGFALGIGGGRTDKNNVNLAAGSYVLPADVVAGLGDGNSLAGAHAFDEILKSMPWGITPPRSLSTHRPPAPPHDPSLAAGLTGQHQQILTANGGSAQQRADGGAGEPQQPDYPHVPIASADGEITLHPMDVLRIGQFYAPDHERHRSNYQAMLRRGHRVLDGFVKEQRGRTIRHLKKLDGPVGSHNPRVGHT